MKKKLKTERRKEKLLVMIEKHNMILIEKRKSEENWTERKMGEMKNDKLNLKQDN